MSLLDISECSDLNTQRDPEPMDNTIHHQLLVECLKKEKKSPSDCERIYDAVRIYDFFKNFFGPYESESNTQILLDLCGEMKYETAKMGTFVFQQGDKSNQKFYVILKGQAGIITRRNFNPFGTSNPSLNRPPVYSMNTIQDEETPQEAKDSRNAKHEPASMNELPKRKATLRFGENFGNAVARSIAAKKVVMKARLMLRAKNQAQSMASLDEEENPDQEFRDLAEQHGNLIRVLNPGNDFGETIFKKPGQKRSVSILCKTDCELLVVTSEAYNAFVTAIREKKKNFILETFSYLPAIRSSLFEHRFVYSFFNQRFSEGDKVTEEGQLSPNPKIYLIETGTCKIQKRFNIEIKNPFNPSQVIHTQTHWLTVCVVGPGTLLGEETLLQSENQEKYEYRTIVTSKKLSTLSLSKQVFIKLHPDIEAEVTKFYHVKRIQREEVYAKTAQELLSQGGNKGDTFFKKHTGLTQLVNKKALNSFAGRENRVIINKSLPISMGNIPDSTSHATQSNVANKSIAHLDKTYLNTSNNNVKFITEPDDVASNQKLIEKPNRDAESQLGKKSAHDHSLSMHRDHHHDSKQSLNESGSINAEGQRIMTTESQRGHTRNILSPLKDLGDDFLNKFHVPQVGKPWGLELDSKRGNFVQSISNDLEKFQRPKTSQLNPLQRVITPKARAIRMKINTHDEMPLIENPRTTKHEAMRNSYLEKIKLPDAPEDLGPENFRFNFVDSHPKRRKRSESVKNNKSCRDSVLSQSIITRKARATQVGDDLSRDFLTLSQQKMLVPLKLPVNEELKGSRSISPSLKLPTQPSESKRKDSDTLEKNSCKDSCISKSSILSDSIRRKRLPLQIIVPSNMELSAPHSIVKVVHGYNDIDSNPLSETKTAASEQQKMKENVPSDLRAAVPKPAGHNLLSKLLMQKSQMHQALHRKTPSRARDSGTTKDTSKNTSLSLLMVDKR